MNVVDENGIELGDDITQATYTYISQPLTHVKKVSDAIEEREWEATYTDV